MYIIGIDGGGTKTDGVIWNTKKGEIARQTIERSNPHNTGFAQSVQTVHTLINRLLNTSDMTIKDITGLGIGMSGLGRQHDQTQWTTLFMKQAIDSFNHIDISIHHDAMIALYSGTYGDQGIVSINGTGSICFGATATQTKRAGGWGHLIDADPGSGYFIGAKALSAVFKAHDTMGPSTVLTELILTHYEEKNVSNLISHIYKHQEKSHIASLAKLTLSAATNGDPVARDIINLTTNHIINYAQTVYQSLFDSTSSVQPNIPFVLIGGIFHNAHVRQTLHEQLSLNIPHLKPLYPHVTPTYGAIVLALKKKGNTYTEIRALLGG